MARSIYFLDGSREVLLVEDNERTELGRIIWSVLAKMPLNCMRRLLTPI